jgi:hypothetical protein
VHNAIKCKEVRDLFPLYRAGEIAACERELFERHFASCAACTALRESTLSADARLWAALFQPEPDASALQSLVRTRIASGERHRLHALVAVIAALFVVTLVALSVVTRSRERSSLAAAAHDHRAEIVDKQTRPWSTSREQMTELLAREGLSYSDAAALAPEGLTLDRLKFCRLNGNRMLHLVFLDGVRSYSLYLQPRMGIPSGPRGLDAYGETSIGFATWRMTGIVVSDAPADDCDRFANFARARL